MLGGGCSLARAGHRGRAITRPGRGRRCLPHPPDAAASPPHTLSQVGFYETNWEALVLVSRAFPASQGDASVPFPPHPPPPPLRVRSPYRRDITKNLPA